MARPWASKVGVLPLGLEEKAPPQYQKAWQFLRGGVPGGAASPLQQLRNFYGEDLRLGRKPGVGHLAGREGI